MFLNYHTLNYIQLWQNEIKGYARCSMIRQQHSDKDFLKHQFYCNQYQLKNHIIHFENVMFSQSYKNARHHTEYLLSKFSLNRVRYSWITDWEQTTSWCSGCEPVTYNNTVYTSQDSFTFTMSGYNLHLHSLITGYQVFEILDVSSNL